MLILKTGVIFLGLIQCAENCKYQIDGYCALEICSNINSPESDCPYYLSRSTDSLNSLSQSGNTDEFN